MTIDRVNDGWSTRSGVRVSAPDIAVDGSDRRRRGHQREVCPCEAGARFFFLAQNHPVCLGLRRPRSGGGGGGGAAAGVCRGCRRVAVPPTFVTFPRLCVALGGRAARGRRRPGIRSSLPPSAGTAYAWLRGRHDRSRAPIGTGIAPAHAACAREPRAPPP